MKMDLLGKIKQDFINARKEKNEIKKTILSVLIGEISKIEKSKERIVVTDTLIIKEIKNLVNANEQTNNLEENVYLECYLPKMLSDEEITTEVVDLLDEFGVNNTNVKMIGVILAVLNKKYPGMIDGKNCSRIIREQMLNK